MHEATDFTSAPPRNTAVHSDSWRPIYHRRPFAGAAPRFRASAGRQARGGAWTARPVLRRLRSGVEGGAARASYRSSGVKRTRTKGHHRRSIIWPNGWKRARRGRARSILGRNCHVAPRGRRHARPAGRQDRPSPITPHISRWSFVHESIPPRSIHFQGVRRAWLVSPESTRTRPPRWARLRGIPRARRHRGVARHAASSPAVWRRFIEGARLQGPTSSTTDAANDMMYFADGTVRTRRGGPDYRVAQSADSTTASAGPPRGVSAERRRGEG